MSISWPGVALATVAAGSVLLALKGLRDEAAGCGCGPSPYEAPWTSGGARDWRGMPTDQGADLTSIPQNPNDYELPWSVYSGPLYKNVPLLRGAGSPIPSNPNDNESAWSIFSSGLYRN